MGQQETSAGIGLSKTLEWIERRLQTGDVFLVAAVVSIAPLFFSNNYLLAPKIFDRIFFLAAALPWVSLRFQRRAPPVLELSTRLVLIVSVILAAAFFYLLALNVSSWLQPGSVARVIDREWVYAGKILVFLLSFAVAVAAWKDFLPRFVTVLSSIVAASALYNMIVYLSGVTIGDNLAAIRLVNSLGMPGYTNSTNISITYALLFVASVAVIVDVRLPRFMRYWLVPVGLVLLAAILLTQSRSAYLAVIVGLMVVLWTAPQSFRRAAIACFIAGVLLGAAAVMSNAPTRAIITTRGESYRPEIWSVYAGMALQKPLLGYGGLSDIGIRIRGNIDIDQPHNLILSAQIRGGIFCALAMIMMLLGSLYWSIRFLRLRAEVIPLSMIATLATAGMFDYNLLVTPITWPWVTFWLPFAICAGAEIAVKRNSTSPA